MSKLPTGALLVEKAKDGSGFYFAAKWRADGKPVKLRLGRAWIEARPEPLEGADGWHRTYKKRRGNVKPGYLLPNEAAALMRETIRGHAGKQEREREHRETVTFEKAAGEWIAERSAVADWKPTTLRNYSALLATEDAVPKHRGRKPHARIMRAFGSKRIESITVNEVRKFLRKLDADESLSARSVNAHRQVLNMVFGYAVEQGWRSDNPVEATDKRREADPAEIVTYTPEQVMAIAREAPMPFYGDLIVTAAFTGLRQGEVLELRWRDVDFSGKKLHVQRSVAPGFGVTTTKGRRSRVVPMADPVAQVLARLSQRGFLVRKNDLVFPGPKSELVGGTHHDPTTLRRIYKKARDEAAKHDRDMPRIRFHDLRHTFGSEAAAGGLDLVLIQNLMGHRDSRTTARYLHARNRADDADRLTKAFGLDTGADLLATPGEPSATAPPPKGTALRPRPRPTPNRR